MTQTFCYLYDAESHTTAWQAFIAEVWPYDRDLNRHVEPLSVRNSPADKNSWLVFDIFPDVYGASDSTVRVKLRDKALKIACTKSQHGPCGITQVNEDRWAVFGVHPTENN